ncbi:MAG: glycosyltransferase family 4 protein [Methylomonas sp.]|nr:glycosyltransferase family 4 protein [Methylomonas sp.]PPD20772.1 MAG: glycosyl transferase [Methylomonas sp.]PPD27305.1 MAG: glycosyl transferase [Methylomonas sp.]PPD39276.1 MAG: glycosyl transferase [Methylomonas sp.]PPD40726.1 MAG: glycosyl transferase [Methylomonas sp.]
MLFHYSAVLLLAWLTTGAFRYYAIKRNRLDIPNHRSSHSVPTPRGGGWGIVVAFYAGLLWLYVAGVLDDRRFAALSLPVLVVAVGHADDVASLAMRWRFAVHVLTAVLIVAVLSHLPPLWLGHPFNLVFGRFSIDLGWLGYPLAVLALVWCINLFNFMDGIDGIAASQALFVSGSLAAYSYYLDSPLFTVAVFLAAATMGFLIWNWPPARIFMGDVGSGFLGLLLGVLMVLAAEQAMILLYCGLILFGVFIVDASYTLLMRVATKQQWYQAHCCHAYQRAAKRFGHRAVLLAVWAIDVFWLLPLSLLVFKQPDYACYGLIVAYVPLIVLAWFFQAGVAEPAAS